jgi:preprotein translocase subunit SecD
MRRATVAQPQAKAGTPGLFLCLALLAASGLAVATASRAAEPVTLAVASANVARDAGRAAVDIVLKPDSKAALASFTADHVGQTIAISVDGKVVMSARLVEPISGGTIRVSGSFSRDEARALARRLGAGEARLELSADAP